jgi:molybdate transport system substrate-binding protein
VNVFVAPSDLSFAQIERGARCDVIFALAGSAADEAARKKIIDGGTIQPALRNGFVLIGHEPGAAPNPASPSDVSGVIAGKRLAIANPDRDAAGAYAIDLLRGIGISIDGANKNVAVAESSAGVVNMLATGKAALGIVYATDAAGFKLAVPLPALDRVPVEYIVAQARDPASDTKPFIAFLRSPEAKAVFKTAGLQPLEDGRGGPDASARR